MILVRPRNHGGDLPKWHVFLREDSMQRWQTACGHRLDLAEFQSGHQDYIECRRCRAVIDIKEAA